MQQILATQFMHDYGLGYNGVEVFVENFEVLASDNKFAWEPASNGSVAEGAVSTGRDGNDEIYIGRAAFQGSMTVGKVKDYLRVYLEYFRLISLDV